MEPSLVYGHGSAELQSALGLLGAAALLLGLAVRRDRRLWLLWLLVPASIAHAVYWVWSPRNDFATFDISVRIHYSVVALLKASPMAVAFIGTMLLLERGSLSQSVAGRIAASVAAAVVVRAVQAWIGLAW